MFGTDIDARRFQTDIDAVRAVIAFRRRVVVRLHIKRVIRAGLRAGFAADTASAVEIDNAVVAREKRGNGADFDARRVGAVIAPHHRKKPSRVGESSLFDVFYPRSVNADWHFVFGFAGDRTGVTADTLAVIDDKTIVHKLFVLLIFASYYGVLLRCLTNTSELFRFTL